MCCKIIVYIDKYKKVKRIEAQNIKTEKLFCHIKMVGYIYETIICNAIKVGWEMQTLIKRIYELKKNVDKVFIYGTGVYGRNIYNILCKYKIKIDGFVQSVSSEKKELFELPIYKAEELLYKNVGFIVGVNRHNYEEISAYLKKCGFSMERVINGGELIDHGGVRGGYDEKPSIDLTTKIGCSVKCKYCPQNLLLEKYFKDNPGRDTKMSMETFEICLSKLPFDCEISFAGMVEPFLNPLCVKMMEKACETGREVNLYTTLVGATIEDLKRILELPIQFITLHVADKCGYAHIPVSEEYYKKVEMLVNCKKRDGSRFINICNAQTEPNERIKEICRGKIEILTTLHDRAGNLEDKDLVGKKNLQGKLKCGVTGDKLNNNVLLPDGTVLLCFMDYGMKHVLGNLKENSYEEIINGEEMKRIKQGLMSSGLQSVLCRNCSCANCYEEK